MFGDQSRLQRAWSSWLDSSGDDGGATNTELADALVAMVEDVGMANTSESPILRYFEYAHLSAELQDISQPCSNLASYLETRLPAGAEKSTALRKLLECKDAAVRAALPPK